MVPGPGFRTPDLALASRNPQLIKTLNSESIRAYETGNRSSMNTLGGGGFFNFTNIWVNISVFIMWIMEFNGFITFYLYLHNDKGSFNLFSKSMVNQISCSNVSRYVGSWCFKLKLGSIFPFILVRYGVLRFWFSIWLVLIKIVSAIDENEFFRTHLKPNWFYQIVLSMAISITRFFCPFLCDIFISLGINTRLFETAYIS